MVQRLPKTPNASTAALNLPCVIVRTSRMTSEDVPDGSSVVHRIPDVSFNGLQLGCFETHWRLSHGCVSLLHLIRFPYCT